MKSGDTPVMGSRASAVRCHGPRSIQPGQGRGTLRDAPAEEAMRGVHMALLRTPCESASTKTAD